MNSRIVPNKCIGVRANVEGCAYRLISFFHQHPSETSEDAWTVFRTGKDIYLVDKLTLAVMAEHECEFMTRAVDSDAKEPSIVSVRLTPLSDTGCITQPDGGTLSAMSKHDAARQPERTQSTLNSKQ